MKRLVIIGGGPAGMMAAVKAAQTLGGGDHITLYDKNERLGRKIYLTGKGRCNLTNMKGWQEFSTHIHPNQEFLKHAFRAFSNEDVVSFFESAGVPTTVTQGQRVFPVSMKAADVARALEKAVLDAGVQVVHSTYDGDLDTGDKSIIIATGGLSYPVTGSTGDGYELAKGAGHTIASTFPSETALRPVGYDLALVGAELKNVALQLFVGKDLVQSEEGDFNFTEDGMESGIAYKISRKAVWSMVNGQRVEVLLDMKPALSIEKLAARISRDVMEMAGKPKMQQLLRGLMPEQLILPFTSANGELSIENLPFRLKNWRFKVESYKGYERAVVTAGGVNLKEIVPKTMQSRLREGLFFAGEVIDLDGDTGGYNLQIAFSTGALAGVSAAKSILKEAHPDG